MTNELTARQRGMLFGLALAVAGFALWKLFARIAWVNGNYTLTVPCQQWYNGAYESLTTRMTCVVEKSIWNYSPDFLSREWNQTHLTGALAVVALYALAKCTLWLVNTVGPNARDYMNNLRSDRSVSTEDRVN